MIYKPFNPVHNRLVVMLRCVRQAKAAYHFGNYPGAMQNLAKALALANQMPPGGRKPQIISGIFRLRNRVQAKYRKMRAEALAYVPSGMDLMKDYGEGRMVRRPPL